MLPIISTVFQTVCGNMQLEGRGDFVKTDYFHISSSIVSSERVAD